MINSFQRREIGRQIFFSKITDSRFKTNMISINLFSPLSKETASENAVASRYLSMCCKKYPTYSSMNNKLSAMYSTKLSGGVVSLGDTQVITFSINYIDSKYALNGEKMNEEAVNILNECLFNPLTDNDRFDEKFISLERQAVIDDIEAEINDKQAYASQKAAEIMFKNEPYALRALGSVQKAKEVTAESAYKAFVRLLHRCRIEIICSGVSDFEDVKKKLTCSFSSIKRKEIFSCETLKSPLKAYPERITDKMDITQSNMILGFKTDCPCSYSALQLMNEIYGGSPTSKLFINVREKKSLCYSCWSTFNWLKGSAAVKCGVEKDNIEKAYNEILYQLELMKNGEFSEDDLINAKMYRKNYLKTFNDNLNVMAVWYLTRIYCDDIATPEEMALRDEKVTKDEIIAAARSLKLDTFYVLTSEKKNKYELS